jgi:1-aminocyclopropane-1-carboxylate deaminase
LTKVDYQPSIDISANLSNSPLQHLESPFLTEAGIQLYIKRDDLLHPQFGGNKWRKLKYNLIYARDHQFDTLLTFGGAWSNHIYATAAAGKHFGFNTTGIIRGEKYTPLNPTLSFAEECGMQLHYVSREEYRQKNETLFLQKIKQQFGNVYILPEGGSNSLAIKGCEQIVHEISNEMNRPFDVICCASGTGATLAGLISAITPEQTAIGFSALKGGDFLTNEVKTFLNCKNTSSNWRIESRFHFGGYAKIDDELIQFMREFNSQYGITLDAVYTGKMFYGLFKLIQSKNFEPGTTIITVHSGGLQGNKGFNL